MIRLVFSTALLCALAGCTLISDSLLHGPVEDCEGEKDGTPCAAAEICVQGACIYSACGDGFLDHDRGEACDDANLVSGDGCEPGLCRYSCEIDLQCEDPNPCRATTGCNVETHTCRPLVATSGATCERPDGSDGVCNMGFCPAAGCGDGTVVAPEECDDHTPGCAADCTYLCEVDADCVTNDVCAAPMACDITSHTCAEAPMVTCDDADACTADVCDPLLACQANVIDADGDGISPGTCAIGSMAIGGDCDDGNPDIRPGAPEAVDGIDQDCDTHIDENPGVNCLRDVDRDGYGDPNVTMFAASCRPELGWVAPRTKNDCQDQNVNVNPSQTTPVTFPYCPAGSTLTGNADLGFACSGGAAPSWDWNCDTVQAPTNNNKLVCASASVCGGTGWQGNVPACGAIGTSVTCAQDCVLVICSCKGTNTPNVRQSCL